MKCPPDYGKVLSADLTSCIPEDQRTDIALTGSVELDLASKMRLIESGKGREERFRETLGELNPEALLADGFGKAIMGYASRCGLEPVAVYDYSRCVHVLMTDQNFTHEEAVEWMDFNVVGSYMGSGTPLFFTPIEEMGL